MDHRIDTFSTKDNLLSRLTPDAQHSYQQHLGDFLSAKTRHSEFHDAVAPLLQDDGLLTLHNEFIYSLLRNAHSLETSPAYPQHRPKKTRDDPIVDEPSTTTEQKRKVLKRYILSLPKADRERIKANLRAKKQQQQVQQVVMLPGGRSQYYQETKGLPDVHALLDRMNMIAMDQGLAFGSHVEAAQYLEAALHMHLRSMVEHVSRTLARPVSTEHPITTDDLQFVLGILTPHVLVEQPICMERMLVRKQTVEASDDMEVLLMQIFGM